MTTPHILTKTTIIERPLAEVFEFFSKAENLNLLTPPEVAFKIITPTPIAMKVGTHIDYRIRVSGIPFKWKTLISAWEPPYRFIDTQVKGPYKVWIHEHTFKDIGNNRTEMVDTVQFLAPGGIFEPIINQLFIKKKVTSIFDYREKQLKALFA